jgi:hypothetical protein
MAKSVKEKLIDSLRANLLLVKKSSGYNVNIYQVLDEVSPSALKEFPGAIISEGATNYDQQVASRARKSLEVVIDVYMDKPAPGERIGARAQIERSIEKMVFDNWTLSNAGENTATYARLVTCQPIGIDEQDEFGVSFLLNLIYGQDIKDDTRQLW